MVIWNHLNDKSKSLFSIKMCFHPFRVTWELSLSLTFELCGTPI